jgi:hypothetical protein
VPNNGRDAATLREEILESGLTPGGAVALADALEGEGRLLEALEYLVAAARLRRDPATERRLVRLRRRAFAALDRSLPPPPWPPAIPDDPPGAPSAPPIIAARDLTPGAVRTGILRHGCIVVRGLVPPARAARLREAIDRAFAAREAALAGIPVDVAWYDPVEDVPDGDVVRAWVRASQAVLAADSPRAFHEFLETVHDVGLDRVIAAYLGERPSLSVQKCTLRRVDATTQHAIWHQDGAFLGKGIRTINAWFALTPCGRDAPGMDLIPVRLERVLTTGEAGAGFDWTVSHETIARELPGVTPWRPVFEAGDALLFDHMLIHRTAAAPGMTRLRYAIESWFFASSVYPASGSTPLVV